MHKHIQLLFLLALLVGVLLIPSKAKGDVSSQLTSPVVEVEKEIEIIEIPKNVKPEFVEFYLMVYDEFHDDAPVMIDIARAESHFDPTIKNPASSARGLFQILTGTWAGHKCTGSVINAADNIACARKIYTANGTRDWDASKENWYNKTNK